MSPPRRRRSRCRRRRQRRSPEEAGVLDNSRSDRVRAVRRLADRSARARAGMFLAEGPQAVREALRTPHVVAVYATASAAERHADLVRAPASGAHSVDLVSEAVMSAMADTVTPQGVLAVCRLVDVPLEDVVRNRPRLVAVLADVRDPGNAGTVIRAADAAGADGVVLAGDSVDVHNPKCVRATAGSLFHVPVVSGVPLADAVTAFRAAGLTVLAAAGSGDFSLDALLLPTSATDTALGAATAWVFGNEAWGLRAEGLGLADAVVRVPIFGRAESLNLAMAATVCLYASAFAQRRPGTPQHGAAAV